VQPDGTLGLVLRQHDSALPRFGRRGKRGQQHQALGRSRGSFSTKIHLKTDLDGNPLDFHLTAGGASDSTQFETSRDIGPDIRPRIAMTDKGYDSHANRAAALARGITPVVPRRENSKQRGRFFPKRLYKLRARIEQAIGKLKRFKRVAMRCEKTDISYSTIVSFACGLMLVKSIHAAQTFVACCQYPHQSTDTGAAIASALTPRLRPVVHAAMILALRAGLRLEAGVPHDRRGRHPGCRDTLRPCSRLMPAWT
jgi:transposase